LDFVLIFAFVFTFARLAFLAFPADFLRAFLAITASEHRQNRRSEHRRQLHRAPEAMSGDGHLAALPAAGGVFRRKCDRVEILERVSDSKRRNPH